MRPTGWPAPPFWPTCEAIFLTLTTILYILFGIFIFGVLIATHELGHFTAAKLFGVRVNEYSIGMGPAIVQWGKGETQYALRWLPVGGYCALEGEDGNSQDPRSFASAAWWKRAIILVSGAAMNFLTGFLILVALYSSVSGFITPTIDHFYEGCSLESAQGLQAGDTLYKIDNHRIYTQTDVSLIMGLNQTGRFDLVVLRDGKKVELKDFPMEKQDFEVDGEVVRLYGMVFSVEENTFPRTLRYAWNLTKDYVRSIPLSVEMIAKGQASVKDASGVVGIVDVMAEAGNAAETVGSGLLNILSIGALVAINLGAMNLLPIPALDGGRLFGLLIITAIEALTKKKVNPKIEAYIHGIGMILLLILMAVIAFKDIFYLFR